MLEGELTGISDVLSDKTKSIVYWLIILYGVLNLNSSLEADADGLA